jgi:hypothetical protein
MFNFKATTIEDRCANVHLQCLSLVSVKLELGNFRRERKNMWALTPDVRLSICPLLPPWLRFWAEFGLQSLQESKAKCGEACNTYLEGYRCNKPL